MALSEFTAIRRYFAQPGLGPVLAAPDLGIGDDGALLSVPAGQQLVVVADTLVAGVHFPADSPPAHIGHRALAVNLSDLAAMGAQPTWFTLCLTTPGLETAWLEAFCQGLGALAAQAQVALVGGDTTRGPLSVTVQAMGTVAAGQGLQRDGARVGDSVCVTGTLGDAAGGLACIERPDTTRSACIDQLIESFWSPQPRLREAAVLRGVASSCIDISDGLLADLGHICHSSGVGAQIHLDQIPVSNALKTLGEKQALTYAMSGGDDYELCFTVEPGSLHGLEDAFAAAGGAFSCIGQVIEGRGVVCFDQAGEQVEVEARGYEHFSE